jgi:hypothetical protein
MTCGIDSNSNVKCKICKPGYTLNSNYLCIRCALICTSTCNPNNIT